MEWWSRFWGGLNEALSLVDGAEFAHFLVRIVVAAFLGGVIGFEREESGKSAGMRTHMLVSLAAAFFVLGCQQAGMANADLSRVVQGVATGVGFLGAGAILKQDDTGRVRGLTTAAGVYLATAVGIAAGLGRLFQALLVTLLALIILHTAPHLERQLFRFFGKQPPNGHPGAGPAEPSSPASTDTHSRARPHKP
jgi:putative Mg2+ transporter-C (MgtC) family protein